MRFCVLPRCHSDEPPAADSLCCEPCIEHLVRTLRDTEECIAALTPMKAVRPGMVNTSAGFESASPAADHTLVILDPRSSSNGHRTEWGVGRVDRPDDDPDPLLSVAVLGEWARMAGWSVVTVRDAVSGLLVNHRWITSQPWVVDYADELGRLHLQAARAIGDGPPEPVASCTRKFRGEPCGGPIVQWERLADDQRDGAGGARCLACRTPYHGPDLVRLRLAQQEAS